MIEPYYCKCGRRPDLYTSFPVATQKYQGTVECPECGEYVKGKCHWYDKDNAVEDAIEEWNKVMGKLEPCPNCGEEVTLKREKIDAKYEFYHVTCKCRLTTGWQDTEADAIHAWNNRIDLETEEDDK